jgi:hypothetical protein
MSMPALRLVDSSAGFGLGSGWVRAGFGLGEPLVVLPGRRGWGASRLGSVAGGPVAPGRSLLVVEISQGASTSKLTLTGRTT